MTASRRAVIFRIGALGDVLLTRRLTYSLHIAGFRSTLFAPARHARLLSRDPWIDEVVDSENEDARKVFAGEWPFSRPPFDVALVVSASAELREAAVRAARTTIVIAPTSALDDVSIAAQWARGAAAVAPPYTGVLPSLPVDPNLSVVAGATLIHPGSGSAQKNWPIDRFVDLSRTLRPRGHRVLWVRGPAEAELASPDPRIEWLEGVSLDALAATLASARLFVGNDSGVTHLAAAVGTPTIALFGPSNDSVWRPDGRHVRILRGEAGEFTTLTTSEILALVSRLRG